MTPITNSYASILNYLFEKSIVGPLPVFNHKDLQVLAFKFEIVDNDVIDKRVVSNGGKTIGLLTLFYKVKLDAIFKQLHKNILLLISNWIKKFENIKEITQLELSKLMDEIYNLKMTQENSI